MDVGKEVFELLHYTVGVCKASELVHARIRLKVSGLVVFRICDWTICNFVVDVFFTLFLLMLRTDSQFTMYKVSFNKVMTDIAHESLVIVVSTVQDSGNLYNILPMQGSANVGSKISLVIAYFVDKGRRAFVNAFLLGMPLYPTELDGISSFG